MRKLIFGRVGTGKTTLIVNKIIPTIENYLVFDFCNEYYQWIKDESKIKKFGSFTIGKELRELVIDAIRKEKKDTTLIIDNTNLLRFRARTMLVGMRG